MFLGFTFGADSISEEVTGFYPLCFIVVHVILSVNDLKIIMLA